MKTPETIDSEAVPTSGSSAPRRLFVHEPGWRVSMKVGSEREYCYMMSPGQDYYHRLLDGEVYVNKGDERICFACAERRGLLSFEAKQLRPSIASLNHEIDRLLDEPGVALVERPESS